MKHTHLILVGSVALSTFFCIPLPVLADNQPKDKTTIQNAVHTIQSAVQKMDKAANNRDADGAVAFIHPDFVNIDKTGKETTHGKEEARKERRKVLATLTQIMIRTTITSISFSNEGAVVNTTSNLSASMVKSGKSFELKGTETCRDLWVEKTGVWLQKKSQTLTSTFTVNGQPMP
jgi:ketosteroid isomerase-like protein